MVKKKSSSYLDRLNEIDRFDFALGLLIGVLISSYLHFKVIDWELQRAYEDGYETGLHYNVNLIK
jgi:hypothetical protein